MSLWPSILGVEREARNLASKNNTSGIKKPNVVCGMREEYCLKESQGA
jgi:hypothetical protein